ncbi:cellulase family glycosylhydrolase [Polaribacter sp. L3A8]|uniref:cellulase family glycosylhydrolase n=1 Tax=Polaribacter sp. L3A8 TaxID=2686361 RepID=UPI00131CEE59|nr:cellulase family glycosylhydrolase [Polaribacter sp. L3A8]
MTKLKLKFYALFIFSLISYGIQAQSIVDKHGRLRVDGNTIVDKSGTSISLAGNSLFWSNAGDSSDFYNSSTVNHLADNWNSSIIRIAMGVKESWDGGTGYIDSPIAQKNKIKKVIDAAIAKGIYVIIDWHTHEAENYQEESVAFFREMAELYGQNDNVIYEIYNEPIKQPWSVVKSYATQVINAIRSKDSDNLIIVGSPNWSQDVDVASQSPIVDSNTAYALHFYAGTHSGFLRDKVKKALNNGVAIFATEWGAVNADGKGDASVSETEEWMRFLKENKISHVNWAVSDKPEGASIINSGKGISGLQNDDLTATGVFVKDIIKNWSDDTPKNEDTTTTGKIECNTVECILNAMKNAKPGNEIIIAPGTYVALEKDNTNGRASLFFSAKDGNADKPIIIRAKDALNPPILKGKEGKYDGYVMRIIGDYWQIKNLILEDGSKGLVFDNANNGLIENITVRDIGEEGIHLRDGSSNNLVTGCNVSNTGVKKPGFGEGLYVGSDKSQHNNPYSPDCNNNTIENCIIGPNVAAEGVDIKEGTLNTIIRNCTFSAEGITGENSADAFIDLKGAYTFVYGNTFNLDGSTIINSAIDFQDRKTNYNTGYRNAVFNNTFNLGTRGADIPSMRAKGGSPSEIHFWNNTRNPNTADPTSSFSLKAMVLSCPSWNIVKCDNGDTGNSAPTVSIKLPNNGTKFTVGETISIEAIAADSDGSIAKVEFYNNNEKLGEDSSAPYKYSITNAQIGNYNLSVKAIDNIGATAEANITVTVSNVIDTDTSCVFNTPSPNALPTFTDAVFLNAHVLGTGGPDLSNLKKFRINWNSTSNILGRFAINTKNGVPTYYLDLKKKMTYDFGNSKPELTISNSGISNLDDSYWVAENNGNFVMVSKSGNFTIYFNNSTTAPSCNSVQSLQKVSEIKIKEQIKLYPNPVRNQQLTITHIPEKGAIVKIFDLQGKVVIKQTLGNTSKTVLDISQLKTGLYVVSIQNKGVLKTILLSKL